LFDKNREKKQNKQMSALIVITVFFLRELAIC